MRFYIEIKNMMGSFVGAELNGTEEQFEVLKQKMSEFYSEPGYEMALADGSFFIVGPDILRQSIVIIHTIE